MPVGQRAKGLKANPSAHLGISRRSPPDYSGWLAGVHRL